MTLTLGYFRHIACIIILLLSLVSSAQIVTNGCTDGTVATSQSVCRGTQPDNLLLTANTGAVIKWQSSSTTDFSTPTDIGVTSSILSGNTIGAIVATTYFRAIIQSETCDFAASGYATISVKDVAPNLGSVSRFTLFTSIGAVSNTGITTVKGDVGTHAGDITGFEPPSTINGTTQNANAVTLQAATDVNALYNTLYSTPATNSVHLPVFGNGEILPAGVYAISQAASVAGNLTLDAQGDPDKIFIFRSAGALTTGAGTTVTLINGAAAANIFWVADGAIVIGAATSMKGILVANGNISLGAAGTLTGNMYSTGGAVSTYANTIIPASLTGGKLIGGATICSSANTAVLTLAGYNGSITKWQSSTVSDFSSNVSDIANTTAILTTPVSDESTWFRAVIGGSGCTQELYSETAALIFNKTEWDGTAWSNGFPTFEYGAVINGNYSSATNGEITACSLLVTSGNVTVAEGDAFVIKGIVVVTGGTMTIENNGSLIQEDDVNNTGNITVLKNSNALYRQDYTLWSSPVAGQKLLDFSPATLPNRFYIYGINNLGVEAYIATDASADFTLAKGYMIRMPNILERADPDYAAYTAGTASHVFEGEFTGVPNNGYIETPMSIQDNFFSLVGNPYPSPINVQEFFDRNESALSSNHGIYLWRKKNNGDATSYATLNKVAYVANDGAILGNINGGQEWEDYFATTPRAEWVLGTGQGFLVAGNGSGDDLLFTNQMRAEAASGQPFFRTNQNNTPAVSRLWLNMSSESNFSQAAIAYMDDATMGLDFGKDSKKFSIGLISLYTLADSQNLAIQTRPAFNDQDVVPVGYNAVNAGSYTISLRRKDGLFTQGQQVYLKDKMLSVTHNFADGQYAFATEAGTFNDRFDVVYATSTLGVQNPGTYTNTIVIYKQSNTLHINCGKDVIAGVKIFDVRGRIVYQADEVNASATQISNLTVEQQVLIVQVTTTDNVTVSKKVIY
jgi:hypothetical protein